MFFNPLFISNASAGNNAEGTKEGKFTNSNYLFADIINISKENISFSETDVKLDAKNQSLFNNLKGSGNPTSKKNVDTKNNYLGNSESLSLFLSNVLGTKVAEKNVAVKEEENKATGLSVVPEHVAQLVETLNAGNTVSIPLDNDGKTVFVEIQKYDKNLSTQKSAPKSINLSNSQNKEIQFSEIDFKQIVADISTTLRSSFNSDNPMMSKEKVEAIISKIEASFSNLVSLNNETFQPQKNILGSLISTIEKEFDLSASESEELKNVIVAQFVKVINKAVDSDKQKSTEIEASNSFIPLNSVVAKLNLNQKEQMAIKKLNIGVINTNELKGKIEESLAKIGNDPKLKSILSKFEKYLTQTNSETNTVVEKLPIKTIAKEESLNTKLISKILNLTPTESKVISDFEIEKIDLNELKKIVTSEVVKNPKHPEFKSLMSKLEKFESSTNNDLIKVATTKSEIGTVKNKNITTKSKVIKKIKSGIKSVLTNSNSANVKVENQKTEYLFTLKNERTVESLPLDRDLKIEKKEYNVLKKSIYTNKETAELANLKLVPVSTEVGKFEFSAGNHRYKKGVIQKVFQNANIIPSNDAKGESSSENNSSSNNEQSLSDKNIAASKIAFENSSDKSVVKENQNYVEVPNKKEGLPSKKSTSETSGNNHEIKVSEISTPKTSVVEHQLRNNLFDTTEKVIRKNVDIKDIKKEVSNLIQKGEKKLVEFNLNPENLGKIAIKLEVVNKVVTASIKVENEVTQQIIQNSLEGLKTSLNHNGVQFNALNVSLSNSEERNQRYFKQKRKNNRVAKMNIEGFDEKFSHKNLGYNKYDFIA